MGSAIDSNLCAENILHGTIGYLAFKLKKTL